MKLFTTIKLLCLRVTIVLMCSSLNGVSAQSLNPALHRQAADVNGFTTNTKTIPLDDAVLADAPTSLNLQFPQRVRLVKLTLRKESSDWVDINFRYSPRVEAAFTLPLPSLTAATYYTADWAILSANDQLVRGSFSFSFGPDAKPPSIEREANELLLQLRYGDTNVRSVPPPPTQIIINQDPPQYDPPFTIILDGASVPIPR
ncbi:MAG: copper resistance protein CopC [Gammaproteobacteria bacterium]|nr:copper resistance protein CopC [Gammaproteobacteria bacterium]